MQQLKRIVGIMLALVIFMSGACAQTLEQGDQGDTVAQVQQWLIDLGYLSGEADGHYGSLTREAVSAFQSDNGLSATGVVNNSTYAALAAGGQDRVTALQEKLIELGYLTGEADGIYGTATADAVLEFQKDNDLEETSIADEDTLYLLLGDEEEEESEEDVSEEEEGSSEENTDETEIEETEEDTEEIIDESGEESSDAFLILEEDAEEEDASDDSSDEDEIQDELLQDDPADERILTDEEKLALAQERLIAMGYLSGEADGVMGEDTEDALKDYQEDHDLTESGELDDETYALLTGEAEGADRNRIAQQRLSELGYLTGTVDGIIGAQSTAAITLFQQMNALGETGELDDDTYALLISEDAKIVRAELSSGDKGDAVTELQQRLIDLGFLDDEADGSYGSMTAEAVKLFQEHVIAQGLSDDVEADGVATSLTQDILFDEEYSVYLKDLSEGDEDSEVLRLERRLHILGYLDADADEVFDDYTAAALIAFQTDSGLTADGVATEEVQDALYASDAAVAERWTSHDIALGDDNGVVEDVQGALMRLGFLAEITADGEYVSGMESALESLYDYLVSHDSDKAELFAEREVLSAEAQDALFEDDLILYSEDVQKGADETETARVQTRLYTLLYLSESGIDGDYGSNSTSAIESFQENNDLEVTGIADEETQAVLFSDTAVGNWTKYKLEVSIDDQRVYVYELDDDGVYQHIDTFICSTGLGNSTPTGVFTNTTPLNRWHYFTKYTCWAQYSFRIQGNILFHSVLYSKKDESTLRSGSVSALGRKASHGCVRLKVADAKWIYENCEAGTIVIIY